MATKEQVISNFAKQTGKAKNGSRGRYGGLNLFYENQVLYSFGYHFPLAVRAPGESEILDGAEGFGCGVQYIINGDKYSVSTSSHQNECIRKLKSNVQIPFSALEQAWEWATGFTRNLPYKLWQPKDGFKIIAYNKDQWQHTHDEGKTWQEGYFDGYVVANQGGVQCNRCTWIGIAEQDPAPTSRHRLGAVLFTINNKYFLSSFDELDRRNYFLCHVPGEPRTVEEAYENLKPTEVKACEAMSPPPPILRQGDWFFFPSVVQNLKNAAKGEVKHLRLGGISGTHVVTRSRTLPGVDPLAVVSGTVRHDPRNRLPEHKRLKLGDGKSWWIPVKNTSEAGWGARGNVD